MPMSGGTNPSELVSSNITRIVGQAEDYAADVVLRPDTKKALCVDHPYTPQAPFCFNKKIRLDWNNTALTLTTSYQNVFSVSGSGYFFGFHLCATTSVNQLLELAIDGETVFTELTYEFISSMNGIATMDTHLYIGEVTTGDMQFKPPLPIRYESNVTLKMKKTGTAARILNRYLAWFQKET